MKRPTERNGLKIVTYIVLIVATFISLFPFYFMFVSATNTHSDILSASQIDIRKQPRGEL